jgi:hypothetical protein
MVTLRVRSSTSMVLRSAFRNYDFRVIRFHSQSVFDRTRWFIVAGFRRIGTMQRRAGRSR